MLAALPRESSPAHTHTHTHTTTILHVHQLLRVLVGNCFRYRLYFHFFQRAAKRLLGVCEASAVSVSLSEPPHTSVADLGDVFRQPSHIVSLTLSALPGEPEEREKSEAVRSCCGWPQEPTAVPSGLYQPPRPSPFSSPQARRRTTPGTTQGGCQGKKEMERLLAGLDEVSQTLERTQSRCEAIARRCEAVQREREEPDCRLEEEEEDSRVERLLRVAESLTARLISHQQQRRSPTPTATASGELCVCVCVCVRERDTHTQIQRQRESVCVCVFELV